MSRSFQEWVHWIEIGPGAGWIRRVAIALVVVVLSGFICHGQFQGPTSERTLAQAVVGRQLAEGQGYTTLVNYPQTAAHLQRHGSRWNAGEAFPEMHHAPLYPAAIGAVFAVIPDAYRDALFDKEPAPPDGFWPDYLLLFLNVALFWVAAIQTYLLGRVLFDRVVGVVAAAGLILSSSLWQAVVAVNGTPLVMVVVLAVLQACVRVDQRASRGEVPTVWLGFVGLLSAVLFLADYYAGLVIVPVAIYAGYRFSGERLPALLPLCLGFALPVVAWICWLLVKTGQPLGFAWHEVAMKVDGSQADPAVLRTTLSSAAPHLILAKWGNKGLSELQVALQSKLWSGGALLFTAFFVGSFLYRFRVERVNTLRALFAGILGILLLGFAFLTSGEHERHPCVFLAPGILVFGAGFCAVLIASSERFMDHGRWVFTILLAVHAIPLARDAIEPQRLHFHYPPYYPALFIGMRDEMVRRGGTNPGWMADVPAGAAWYSGQRVWAQPGTLREFYAIGADKPMLALVLTPHTLDKPYFSDLSRRAETTRLGDWAQVYTGLITGRLPTGFPLSLPQKVSDNLYVLIDPLAQPLRRP